MKKQYAVLGLGNFGVSVALSLQQLGCEVIAVDEDMEKVQEISDHVSYAMRADIGEPSLMKSLGARNLDGLIVAISENMEANIMATLLAKEEGVPYVLAKAQHEHHAAILRKIGADAVVHPEWEKRILPTPSVQESKRYTPKKECYTYRPISFRCNTQILYVTIRPTISSTSTRLLTY